MTPKKHILILMTEIGFGHKSAARAIAAAIEADYGDECTVTIANPMSDDKTPGLLRRIQSNYDQLVQDEQTYELLYKAGDRPLTAAMLEGGLALLLIEAINETVESVAPDVIIVVQQNYLAPLQVMFRLNRKRIPVMTVITDLTTIHRMWYNPVSDLCVVPTQAAYATGVKHQYPEEKLRLIGIPVHPAIDAEQRSKSELRAEFGWRDDRVTALVVGSKRVTRLPHKLRGLNHSALPLQLVLVAGGDDDLHRQFEAIHWNLPTHIYNYVDNMPALMRAADCIITKAGGLIVSESLAAGLPLLLAHIIEGQETGNATYVVENGAGAVAEDPLTLLETMFLWLADDQKLLKSKMEKARRLGKPRAAHEIAALALELAAQPT